MSPKILLLLGTSFVLADVNAIQVRLVFFWAAGYLMEKAETAMNALRTSGLIMIIKNN